MQICNKAACEWCTLYSQPSEQPAQSPTHPPPAPRPRNASCLVNKIRSIFLGGREGGREGQKWRELAAAKSRRTEESAKAPRQQALLMSPPAVAVAAVFSFVFTSAGGSRFLVARFENGRAALGRASRHWGHGAWDGRVKAAVCRAVRRRRPGPARRNVLPWCRAAPRGMGWPRTVRGGLGGRQQQRPRLGLVGSGRGGGGRRGPVRGTRDGAEGVTQGPVPCRWCPCPHALRPPRFNERASRDRTSSAGARRSSAQLRSAQPSSLAARVRRRGLC